MNQPAQKIDGWLVDENGAGCIGERRLPDMDIATDLGSLLTLALSPPVRAPGSLAAGSATEDAAIDRWRETVRQRVLSLRAKDLGQHEATALDAIERIARPIGGVERVEETTAEGRG